MGRLLGRGVLLGLLALLAFGVGSAGGRSLATTTVTVEVIGKGTVKSDTDGIKCGDGKKTCYLTFSGAVTLTATNTANGWAFDTWSGCSSSLDETCTVSDGADLTVTATFTRASGTTTSTLSVSAALDSGGNGGNVAGTSINCGSGGSVCTRTVLTGSTLTVLQTPDSGFVFGGWGGSCSGNGKSCTVEMGDDETVSATWSDATATQSLLTVTVRGSGQVSGGGLSCSGPGTCTANEPASSTITLDADPDDGFVFTGWTTDCTGIAPSCTLTMSADRTVIATFSPVLTVTVSGNGGVSGGAGAINCGNGASICSAAFAESSTVTLTATAATGSTFLGWTGACGGSATTCTVLMNGAKDVTANFSPGAGTGNTAALTVSVIGNGRVSGGPINCGLGSTACTANITLNTTVSLSAAPDTGATFTGWGGACAGTTPTCTVTMNIAKTVSASFAGGTSTIDLNVSVTGKGTVTGGGIQCGNGYLICSARPALNSSVTLTAAPAAGAKFTSWGGACTGTTPTCTLVMSAAKTVSATFTSGAAPGTLTINVAGRGTVSTSAGKCVAVGPKKTCVQQFTAGRRVTLKAVPAAGAKFLGWSGVCTGAKLTCTVRLDVGRTVTATFSGATGTGGKAVLTALASPTVTRSAKGFLVTLRFRTTQRGLAQVRGLRAGRVATSLSVRVAAGPITIGPFPVAKSGLYTFEVSLAGHSLHWRTCLGGCGAEAPGPPFLLTRETPSVTRAGDVWSVTLHFRANVISVARVRAFTNRKRLVDQRFLARTGRIILGPFLLGPGSYTIQLTATDAYGRVRTLIWIVALAL